MGAGQTVRVGKVTAVYPARHTVRVTFEDTDQNSAELPVLISSSQGAQFYCLPEVGAQVACVMRDNGQETGFVCGDAYSETAPPPFANANVIGFRCGGCQATFDKSKGSFTFVGNFIIEGNVDVNGDVVANGISLTKHVHGGVESGGGSTGGPR